MRFLLTRGADFNSAAGKRAVASTNSGRIALQAASESGHIDIVKLLLANGADVDARSDTSEEDTGEEGPAALVLAAARGHTDMLKLLLQNGSAINAGYETGRTALLAAASGDPLGPRVNNIETIRFLLVNRADPNAKPSSHYPFSTALRYAVEHSTTETCKLLLDYGADVNSVGSEKDGRTTL